MNATTARLASSDADSRAIDDLTKHQALGLLELCDRILDKHRSNFVFREATPAALAEHKAALKRALRACLPINALIADPDFSEPALVSRLHVRIQQLKDAYNTFCDSEVSEEKTEQILREVFPE